MPLPKPRATESEDEFIARCVPVALNEFPDEAQAVAVCYTEWENKSFTKKYKNLKMNGLGSWTME